MAHRVEIRPATLADIERIEARHQDREELWTSYRHTPEQAMRYGIEQGAACAGFIDDEPGGIFGVAAKGRVGAPWAIFTALVERHPRMFFKACHLPLMAMQSNFDYLVNYVDARNEKAVTWLKWLGFTIHPAEPFGVDQLPFHKFDWHV